MTSSWQSGIEVDPYQIRAIIDMSTPTNKKEIQCFTGRLAAIYHLSPGIRQMQPFLSNVEGKFRMDRRVRKNFSKYQEVSYDAACINKDLCRQSRCI